MWLTSLQIRFYPSVAFPMQPSHRPGWAARVAVVLACSGSGRRGVAEAFSVYAGGPTASSPDFTNASSAMESSFRWTYKRPLIRWALAPDFCSALQPLLIEPQRGLYWPYGDDRINNYTTCDRIHAIVRDAFDVWSASNPALHFVDVTARCESERLWRPLDDDRACAESNWCWDIENATERGKYYVDWKVCAAAAAVLDAGAPPSFAWHRGGPSLGSNPNLTPPLHSPGQVDAA